MRLVCGFALLGFLSVSARAQEPVGTGHAVLRGVVADSVRGGSLRGGTVALLGPSRMTLTDSVGRFLIDSIPPGEYQVALFDPLLDTLSLRVVSPGTVFAAGDTVTILLAIPSQATILAAKCGPSASSGRTSALFGAVVEAESGVGVPGAKIQLKWLDVSIGQGTGVQVEHSQRSATTDSSGHYRFCELPAGLSGEIYAVRGSDSTAAVLMEMGESTLGIATLFLQIQPGKVRAGTTRSIPPIRGMVVDGTGRAVSGSLVTLSSSATSVITDAAGRFRIDATRLGTQALLVRRMGYQPVETIVHVTEHSLGEQVVRLDQFVPILESVVINAQLKAGLERVGFARRKRFGLGFYREAADLRDITSVDEFLRTVPVLRRAIELPRVTVSSGRPGDPVSPRDVGPGGGGAAAGKRREEPAAFASGCTRVFIDGAEYKGPKLDDVIVAGELSAIEAYSAAMTPAEFQRVVSCRTVLIWTDWKIRRNF